MKIEEQETALKELEASLQRSAMELDRRLTTQQQEYEKKVQVLMRQLAEADAKTPATGPSGDAAASDKDIKLDFIWLLLGWRLC